MATPPYRRPQAPPPPPDDRVQTLAVRAAGALSLTAVVIEILRVTVLRRWLSTELSFSDIAVPAFVQALCGLALLPGGPVSRQIGTALAALAGALVMLGSIALALFAPQALAGLVAALIVIGVLAPPILALLGLVRGESPSPLRVTLCLSVLAVYAVAGSVLEGTLWLILDRAARDKLQAVATPDRKIAPDGWGLSLELPEGWVVLAPSPAAKGAAFTLAHLPSTAVTRLSMEEMWEGPANPALYLERIRAERAVSETAFGDASAGPAVIAGREAAQIEVQWRDKRRQQWTRVVAWQDGWRYFTLSTTAPAGRLQLAQEAVTVLEGSVAFSAIASQALGRLFQEVGAVAPHLSPRAIRAILERNHGRFPPPLEVFRECQAASLRGVGGLDPVESAELGQITSVLYGAISAKERTRLAAYNEKLGTRRPITPADDADAAQIMMAGTAQLAPSQLSRLRDLLEKAISAGSVLTG